MCSGYVCPNTNKCVKSFDQCDCVWEKKCNVGIAHYVCVSPEISDSTNSECKLVYAYAKGIRY